MLNFVNLNAKSKARGIKIRLKFNGIRKTGPPIVILLGKRAMRKDEINASFLLYNLDTKT